MRETPLQKTDRCFVCGKGGTHLHHVFFGTANRKKSDEDLMFVYLCPYHHNMSNQGVHQNKELDNKLKVYAQKVWMDTYCDKDMSEEDKINKFIERYGRNYL